MFHTSCGADCPGHDRLLGLRGYLTKLLRGEVHAQRASSTPRSSEIAAAMSRKRRVWSRPLRHVLAVLVRQHPPADYLLLVDLAVLVEGLLDLRRLHWGVPRDAHLRISIR